LFQSGRYRINIDHHKTNSYYGELNIVDVDASSTGEIVYMLYEALECPLDSVSAEALYAAIVTDTGSFRYSNTRPVTFSICRKLQETGFDFNRLNVEIFQNKSYEKVLLLNKVFETLKLYTDGKCAVIKLSKELIENLSLHEYATDGIVEFVRDIKGVEVVVFIRHLGGIAHKVSMRSKYDFDVSEIALKFKGGGHKKAAGFKMDQPIDVIETLVVDAIGAAL
jgi:phosphoesterase RecJ-like protein